MNPDPNGIFQYVSMRPSFSTISQMYGKRFLVEAAILPWKFHYYLDFFRNSFFPLTRLENKLKHNRRKHYNIHSFP